MEDKCFERICACALNRIFGNEPKIPHALIDTLGSFSACFKLSEKELSDILGPYRRFAGMFTGETLDCCEKDLTRLQGYGCDFIPINDARYPPLLKECEDSPIGIYLKGDPLALSATSPVSVIGTRDMSLYGKFWCRKIVDTIALISPERPVVSGLAIGIDITAHRAALECGIPTVAVLPTGIDTIYPRCHQSIADTISGTPGCALVTDFPPGTAPMAFTFLRRNRLIAGISEATVLVESKARGGGMITARLAADYGRTLLVLPGRIDDARSAGCNLLLREKLAEAITDMQSLANYLEPGRTLVSVGEAVAERVKRAHRNDAASSPEDVAALVAVAELVRDKRGVSVEEIGEKLGTGYQRASVLAGILCNDGIVDIDLLQRCCIHPKNI